MAVEAQVASQFIPFMFESAFIDDSIFSSILQLDLVYLGVSTFLWQCFFWCCG